MPFTRWFLAIAALVLFSALMGPVTRGQVSAKAGDTGTTRGTLREIDSDFLLIAAPGQLPLRHYFKEATTVPAARPSPVPGSLKPGDWVEVRWSYDDRLEIESIKPAAAPAANPAVVAESSISPPIAPVPAAAPLDERELAPVTTGEKVNGAIDNLLETGIRILELPLFMLLGAVALLGGIAALAIGWFSRKTSTAGRGGLRRILWIGEGALLLFTAVYLVDRKISHLQNQLNDLRRQNTGNAIASLGAPAAAPATARSPEAGPAPVPAQKRQAFLFETAAAQRELKSNFGSSSGITFKPIIYDESADLVQIHSNYPLIQGYLAVIDVTRPDLQIKLAGNFDTKTLTSDFARENNCSIAINGEAGLSPAPGSGLGTWRGYMVSLGKILQREDPRVPRPFLSFDKTNRATFTAAAAPSRNLPAQGYNVLWGRLDSLVNGTVQTADERNRQPRTAMAINADGTRLYLLVVDGRQPNYSMGTTRAEVGYLLKAFGAYNGMLCDEGGSSCMYLDQLGRLVNIPSDNQGQERPTYTHFGISLHPGT